MWVNSKVFAVSAKTGLVTTDGFLNTSSSMVYCCHSHSNGAPVIACLCVTYGYDRLFNEPGGGSTLWISLLND